MPDLDPLRQRLCDGLIRLSLDAPAQVIDRLLAYVQLLTRWNGAYNLSAVRDPAQMITRHLLDSLSVVPFVTGMTLGDLGSGAGLPGIPLAIIATERRVTLIDSNGKKARFLRTAVRELGLNNVSVLEKRVESVVAHFDCITARAFASLADMLAWGGHLLAPGGVWLALKGRFPQDDPAALPQAFRIEHIAPVRVPGLDAQRHIVVIRRDGEPHNGNGDESVTA